MNVGISYHFCHCTIPPRRNALQPQHALTSSSVTKTNATVTQEHKKPVGTIREHRTRHNSFVNDGCPLEDTRNHDVTSSGHVTSLTMLLPSGRLEAVRADLGARVVLVFRARVLELRWPAAHAAADEFAILGVRRLDLRTLAVHHAVANGLYAKGKKRGLNEGFPDFILSKEEDHRPPSKEKRWRWQILTSRKASIIARLSTKSLVVFADLLEDFLLDDDDDAAAASTLIALAATLSVFAFRISVVVMAAAFFSAFLALVFLPNTRAIANTTNRKRRANMVTVLTAKKSRRFSFSC